MPKLTTIYKCPDGSDFPVEWDDPAQEAYSWRWDSMHSPLPTTPLSLELADDIGDGFRRAFDITGAPGYADRLRVHGFLYSRSVPFDDDRQVRASVAKRDAELRMDRILELWETLYRPECEALTRATKSWVDADLTLKQLADRFDQVRAVRRRLG